MNKERNRKILMATMNDMKEFQANANQHILEIHEVLLKVNQGKISTTEALKEISKMNDNDIKGVHYMANVASDAKNKMSK